MTPESTKARDETPRLLGLLNADLAISETKVEFYMCGGAVIGQAFDANPATAHVSALFRPSREVHDSALRVGAKEGLSGDWVAVAVRSYMSGAASQGRYLELSHLSIFVPRTEYALAVKCAAMRLGRDFGELDDVRYLLRALGVTTSEDAMDIVTRYFSERQLAPETKEKLAELLGEQS